MSKAFAPPVAVFDNYWATTLAFAGSLGRQGAPLHFYGSGAGRWSRYCSRNAKCPPIDDAEQFLPWLKERIRSGEITRIAPTTDLIAYYTSFLRSEFSPQVQRTIAPLEEIETCLIKTRFARVCSVAGQPALKIAAPDNPADAEIAARETGFPLILKPKSHLVVGSAERGRLIADMDELRRSFRPYAVLSGQEFLADKYPELRWPLLQHYVAAARYRVYSVSGVKDADGGILAASLSYKQEQWPPDVGVSTLQVACRDEPLMAAGLEVVDRLLSCGIFELELLVDGERLYAIDLNPRAFGFVALDIAGGSDLPWLWYRSTLEPLTPIARSATHVAMEARHTMLHFMNGALSRGVAGANGGAAGDWTEQRAAVSMLGDWADPLPKLISHLYLLRHPRSLVRRTPRS
ncbi:MAG TPA: hypothetical protein VGD54_11550 [Steroidobacteraceae bacterium]